MPNANQAGALGASGIAALVEAWASAWNAHDMAAAAALVAVEVDFVTVGGRWLKGRTEFLQYHEDVHRRHLRDTTWKTQGHAVRPLRDDLALVHQEWTISGEYDAHGRTLPPRSGIFTWVVARAAGDWRIAAAHNTNHRAGTPRRLITGGPS
jgi:uncharacterized protein (TIGR02246 family)